MLCCGEACLGTRIAGNNASFYFGSQWLTYSPGAMNQPFGVSVVKLLLKFSHVSHAYV